MSVSFSLSLSVCLSRSFWRTAVIMPYQGTHPENRDDCRHVWASTTKSLSLSLTRTVPLDLTTKASDTAKEGKSPFLGNCTGRKMPVVNLEPLFTIRKEGMVVTHLHSSKQMTSLHLLPLSHLAETFLHRHSECRWTSLISRWQEVIKGVVVEQWYAGTPNHIQEDRRVPHASCCT